MRLPHRIAQAARKDTYALRCSQVESRWWASVARQSLSDELTIGGKPHCSWGGAYLSDRLGRSVEAQ
jgi:hypothetical protein